MVECFICRDVNSTKCTGKEMDILTNLSIPRSGDNYGGIDRFRGSKTITSQLLQIINS